MNIDGLNDRLVFVFWTGDNQMSKDRLACLDTIANTGCDVCLVDCDSLASWINPAHRMHPAYGLLSAVHRSDYLRAYFMHHYGGGYSDIKFTTESWVPSFEQLISSDALGMGYPELHDGVANVKRSVVAGQAYFLERKSSRLFNRLAYHTMRALHGRMIGNGAFIFRRQTHFTSKWLYTLERRLDIVHPHLKTHPARHPRDRAGVDHGAGPSQYPVPWSFLLGDILGPLGLMNHRRILRNLPPPSFENYQ